MLDLLSQTEFLIFNTFHTALYIDIFLNLVIKNLYFTNILDLALADILRV